MFLHADANASATTVAHGGITIADSGEYMVMARYEALYRCSPSACQSPVTQDF